jgi:hypothetical protein
MLAERDAAPAGGRRTLLPAPRGPRDSALRAQRPVREELAGRFRLRERKTQARPEVDKDAAMARREAPRVGNNTHITTNVASIGAPSPSVLRGRKRDGLPGAAKEYGRRSVG